MIDAVTVLFVVLAPVNVTTASFSAYVAVEPGMMLQTAHWETIPPGQY